MNLTQTTALKWTFYALAAAALFLPNSKQR